MVGVFFAYVLYGKVVHDQGEFYRAFSVAPEAGRVAALVVSVLTDPFGQQLIG